MLPLRKGHILIHGSLAYDYFFSYPGKISDHFTGPEEELYVNLRARGPKRRFGGCAGNVAHTLRLFGVPAVLTSWLGSDGGVYRSRLENAGVDCRYIHMSKNVLTQSAVLLTDGEQNQLTVFGEPDLPRGWDLPPSWPLPDLADLSFAVITSAVPGRTGLLAAACHAASVPVIIDPGKMILDMPDEELESLISGFDTLIVNDYERLLIQKRLNLAHIGDLACRGSRVIVTHGREGAEIHSSESGDITAIPAVYTDIQTDPYGAGDAFLAGYTAGRYRELAIEECCRLGAAAASFAVEGLGTQSHSFSGEDFTSRYLRGYNRATEFDFF